MSSSGFPDLLQSIAGDNGPWLNPKSRDAQFFDQQYDPALKIALKRNVDPAFLLGLAAHESGYGTSPMAHSSFNILGQTPQGDSSPGLKYPSYEAAWQDFDRMWGERIQDAGADSNAFIDALSENNQGFRGTDGRGAFNTQDTDWDTKVGNMIRDVQKNLPQWQGNLDSYP